MKKLLKTLIFSWQFSTLHVILIALPTDRIAIVSCDYLGESWQTSISMFDFKFSQPGYRVSSISGIASTRTRYEEDIYEVKCVLEKYLPV